MSVELEIRDGSPRWWLSPDIWTVPGDDPEGSPGIPIEGSTTYVWAHVHNVGQTPIQNARVRFYWAIPAIGLTRSAAFHIGDAFVSLLPDEASDVLCLAPWETVYVNGGHECLLAEAFHDVGPLPGSAFNVRSNRHVAQINLSVVRARNHRFVLPFEVHNPGNGQGAFTILALPGTLDELRSSASPSNKAVLAQAELGRPTRLALSRHQCPDDEELGEPKVQIDGLQLPPRGRTGFTLAGEIEGGSAVVHILQLVDGQREVGGLSVLILDQ